MKIQIKDHKEDGNVKVRQIHATPGYAFGGVSSWIRHVVSDKLRLSAPHLLVDTHDLIARMRDLKAEQKTHFLKIDIKEFYMMGEVDFLVKGVTELWPRTDPIIPNRRKTPKRPKPRKEARTSQTKP